MSKIVFLIIILITGVCVGAVYISGSLDQLLFPLSPARDLTGMWISSIQGEGLVFEPKYNPPLRVHCDVEFELVQTGNEVTGSFRIIARSVDQLDPNTPYPDFDKFWTPWYPVNGQISSSSIEFEVTIPDFNMTFEGTFLTDVMDGHVEAYQPSIETWYVGNFMLRRWNEK